LTVIERGSRQMRHELLSPDGRKTTVVTYRGLFTLTTALPTLTFEMTWHQDLTQFVPLQVGERIVADARSKSSTNKSLPGYTTVMAVIGVDSIRVGACDYPVFKIDVRGGLADGSRQAVSTRYYDDPSMLTLQDREHTTDRKRRIDSK